MMLALCSAMKCQKNMFTIFIRSMEDSFLVSTGRLKLKGLSFFIAAPTGLFVNNRQIMEYRQNGQMTCYA